MIYLPKGRVLLKTANTSILWMVYLLVKRLILKLNIRVQECTLVKLKNSTPYLKIESNLSVRCVLPAEDANINNDPVRFIIIKATEGVSLMDDNFNENFYQARVHGFTRGAYHFMPPDVPARKQAEFFLHQVHLEPGDLPPVLDIEDKAKWKNVPEGEIQRRALEWLRIVEERYGVKPILYSSVSFRRDILTDKAFEDYPFWMAHYYVEQPTYQGSWAFWQHTDCGRVDGVRGLVDCDVFNGTPEEFQSLLIKEL